MADFDINDYVKAGVHCPLCGMRGKQRQGAEFEHMMRCFSGCVPCPVWVPGKLYLKSKWKIGEAGW